MAYKILAVNILTLLRFAAVPMLFVWLNRTDPLWTLSFVLFALVALSDFLDGYLARKWQAATALGAIIDPLADKALALTLLGLLTLQKVLPQLLFGAMLIRDIGIVLGARLLKHQGRIHIAKPLWVGKLHTAVQFLFIFLCLSSGALLSNWPDPGHAGVQMGVLALWGTTIASGLGYGVWGIAAWIRFEEKTS